MRNPLFKKVTRKPAERGFALVITLSLMILLTVVAVGLLTLSSVALRSTGHGNAMATARAIARLAMMMAIGELQKSMGPDRGVTASADAVGAGAQNPHYVGAWGYSDGNTDSWHWTPKAGDGPDYAGKQSTFKRWLVSATTDNDATTVGYANTKREPGVNAVELVGDLQNGQGNSTRVVVEKVTVNNGQSLGKYAWAVFDESQKAAIDIKDEPVTRNIGREIAMRNAPLREHPEVLTEKLSKLESVEKLYSLPSSALLVGPANADEIQRRFHDFTTNSLGLLTNTAKGGLRKDLTSAFESSDLDLAFLSNTDGGQDDTPYPPGFTTEAGALTWQYLKDHYQKYLNVSIAPGSDVVSYSPSRTTDLKVVRSPDPKEIGVQKAPEIQRLLPVIAKMQLVFSMVAHWPFNVDNRRSILPESFTNFGVPNLVYEPVITLYNPYDVAINMQKIRIRVWDPPVVFRFQKQGRSGTDYFRTGGVWAGLAQFQIDHQSDPNARRCFTMVLADGNGSRLDRSLYLLPGEVKVFSARVEDTWTWGKETAGGYGGNRNGTFFDWNTSKNFGNVDYRSSAAYGKFGVESCPGWDNRAGLQVDHLSNTDLGMRPPTSRYPFEPNVGFFTMYGTDTLLVEAKPQVASGNSNVDFQVDILAAQTAAANSGVDVSGDRNNTEESKDTLRSYRFNFNNVSDEISQNPTRPVISRSFTISSIMQTDDESSAGGKKPFAMLEMTARTTKTGGIVSADAKPWLYNNFVTEGGNQNTSDVGLAGQSYDLRFVEMTGFSGFPSGIDVDPDTFRGYFGASGSVSEGSSFVQMYNIPQVPISSLGALVNANLAPSAILPRVVHPFGNSFPHPLIEQGQVESTPYMDHSYLLNYALWDDFFFSSMTDYDSGPFAIGGSFEDNLVGVLSNTKPAANARLTGVRAAGDVQAIADKISTFNTELKTQRMAKYFGIKGVFNLNSTSVDAWRSVLSSMRGQTINGYGFSADGTSLNHAEYGTSVTTPFPRSTSPIAGLNAPTFLRWGALRGLDDGQIERLAINIVDEIKRRATSDHAPSLSLGEFVNRRLDGDTGILQYAIDKSGINAEAHALDSEGVSVASIGARRKTGFNNPDAVSGFSAEGAPTIITQGDLMQSLAGVASVRGDTFKIRAYGEALAADGLTILARATCEVIVQRYPEYVDPADEPESPVALLSRTNEQFGRRMEIVSFRWLDESEI